MVDAELLAGSHAAGAEHAGINARDVVFSRARPDHHVVAVIVHRHGRLALDAGAVRVDDDLSAEGFAIAVVALGDDVARIGIGVGGGGRPNQHVVTGGVAGRGHGVLVADLIDVDQFVVGVGVRRSGIADILAHRVRDDERAAERIVGLAVVVAVQAVVELVFHQVADRQRVLSGAERLRAADARLTVKGNDGLVSVRWRG